MKSKLLAQNRQSLIKLNRSLSPKAAVDCHCINHEKTYI